MRKLNVQLTELAEGTRKKYQGWGTFFFRFCWRRGREEKYLVSGSFHYPIMNADSAKILAFLYFKVFETTTQYGERKSCSNMEIILFLYNGLKRQITLSLFPLISNKLEVNMKLNTFLVLYNFPLLGGWYVQRS